MHVISLNGAWRCGRANEQATVPAQVPGSIHADLLRANNIPDPFFRDNENKLQWIGEVDWRYRRTFTVQPELYARKRILLRCEGLDTFACIFVNGRRVAETDNMFRLYEWDIKPLLQPGENQIEILFASTLPYIRRRQGERFMPHWEGSGQSWVRKMQCNYGWDWGIKAVTCGIWRSISLVCFDKARIGDVQLLQDHSRSGSVGLECRVTVETTAPASLTCRVRLTYDAKLVAEASRLTENGSVALELTVQNAALWYPNGLGDQCLYELEIGILDKSGAPLDFTRRRIGLRTLRLERRKDRWGESFQFAINGKPFFAKGANWIPPDAIVGRTTVADYRRLLEDAAGANMNMVRVWGGGVYEDDAFYEQCDELGLCVWQDFMFACAGYPAFDKAFCENAAREALDTVRRLRHHACLALWCGNNELEQGLVGDEWTEKTMSWTDYAALFDECLPELIRRHDPQRDYWPSSPHTPCGDRRDFNDPSCGDAHLWGVWHGRQPFEWYRTCHHRFNSEFGFQSFPEPETVYGFTAPEDRNITSYVMEHHQRSGIGNTTIMQYMLDWFLMPSSFENTLWLSQILQGMAMKFAVEHWRRSMPRGMGTLYWQLNDTWPVASWSSIDWHGRWKALHYMAKRFYAPVLVSGVEDRERGMVAVYVTSDRSVEKPARLLWRVTDTHGAELRAGEQTLRTPVRLSRTVETIHLKELLAEHGCRTLLVWLELAAEDEPLSRNLVFFTRPKHLLLSKNPGLSCEAVRKSATNFELTIFAREPALWAWAELRGEKAQFSDNFIHVACDRRETIHVETSRSLSLAEMREKLALRSLVDTWTTPAGA